MSLPEKPITRNETFFSAMAGEATALPPDPENDTREQQYWRYMAEHGGGGGGDVTGVKGDNETDYRIGNVNITAANVGAYTVEQTNTLLDGKTDTVEAATENNLAAFDDSGNLKDSGKSSNDFAPANIVPSNASTDNKLSTAADTAGEEISNTATGTSITLTDSTDGYVQGVTVKGHSRKTKNLAYSQSYNTQIAHCRAGQMYTFSISPNTVGYKLYKNNDSGDPIVSQYSGNSSTFTADEDFELYFNPYSTDYNTIQLEEGSTATPYEPYFSGIKSIGDAGWGVVDLGTLTWQTADGAPSSTYYVQSLPNGTTNDNNKTYLCAYVQYSGILANMPDKSIRGMGGISGVYVRDTTYTDATAFKSAMSGVLLYYPLADTTGATPILGITSKDGEGQGTAATITTGLPLRSVSDSIYDTLDNEKVVKKCYKLVLDGTQEMTLDSGSTTGASGSKRIVVTLTTPTVPLPNNSTVITAISDKLTATAANKLYSDTDNVDDIFSGSIEGTTLAIRLDSIGTVEAAQTYLTSNPITIVYPLATPTETPLTSAEKSALASLRTYDPNTQLDATDAPTMTVDYLLNTNNGKAVAGVDNKIVAIKSVSWTGTGETSQSITFPDTPFMILGFTQNPIEDRYTRGLIPFVWNRSNSQLCLCWSDTQSTVPQTNTFQFYSNMRVTISGNTMSWTGSDASQALNQSGTEYTIYYI